MSGTSTSSARHAQDRHLTIGKDQVQNGATEEQAHAYPGICNSFSREAFERDVKIDLRQLSAEKCVFDLIGADAALANSIRRVMLADIEVCAMEYIDLYQNTGVIPDENLSHRVGLIPIFTPLERLDTLPTKSREHCNETNSLIFKLHVKCPPKQRLDVFARDLVWEPQAGQEERFAGTTVLNPDILLTTLSGGQEIEFVARAVKGVGGDHAKWSPVGTAWYRLKPLVKVTGKWEEQEARALVKSCPMGVFDIEDAGKWAGKRREAKAGLSVVDDGFDCTTCRACLDEFSDRVSLLKDKQHFVFTVEAIGQIPAAEIFEKALDVLVQRSNGMRTALRKAVGAPE